jgi:hypothetical protein
MSSKFFPAVRSPPPSILLLARASPRAAAAALDAQPLRHPRCAASGPDLAPALHPVAPPRSDRPLSPPSCHLPPPVQLQDLLMNRLSPPPDPPPCVRRNARTERRILTCLVLGYVLCGVLGLPGAAHPLLTSPVLASPSTVSLTPRSPSPPLLSSRFASTPSLHLWVLPPVAKQSPPYSSTRVTCSCETGIRRLQ